MYEFDPGEKRPEFATEIEGMDELSIHRLKKQLEKDLVRALCTGEEEHQDLIRWKLEYLEKTNGHKRTKKNFHLAS